GPRGWSAVGSRSCGARPRAQAGLGRPGGARRLDPAATTAAADEPPDHAGHAAALAPAPGPLALHLSPLRRQAAGRGPARGAARSYSLISPPRTLRRRISGVVRSVMAAG